MENSEFLTFFRSEYWNELSDEQKIVQLQDLENLMAEQQGRETRTVVNNPQLDYMGAYDSYNPDYIEINLAKNPTSYDCMDTVIHEGRHATQDACLSGEKYNQNCFSDEEIEALKNNSEKHGGIYRSTEHGDSEVDYYFQPKENDANTYARNTMDGLSEHFQDDPDFENYQNRRNKDYDNKLEKANRQYSDAAENGQSITDCIDEKNRADIAKNEERLKSNGGDVMLKQDTSPNNVTEENSNTPINQNSSENNNDLGQDDDYYYSMGM